VKNHKQSSLNNLWRTVTDLVDMRLSSRSTGKVT